MGDQLPRLMIGNLDWHCDEEQLKTQLEPFGKIVSLRIPRRSNGYSKGCAIAEFETRDQAQACLDALNQKDLFGRKAYITFAGETAAPRRRHQFRSRDRPYNDHDRDRDRGRGYYDRERRSRRRYNDYSDDEYSRDRDRRPRRRHDYYSDDEYDYSYRRSDRFDRRSPPRNRRGDSPRRYKYDDGSDRDPRDAK